jgi:tetratricopeptide (TPR) repeat protein
MIGPEQLAAGERAEATGDFLVAAAAYRSVTTVAEPQLAADAHFRLGRVSWRQGRFDAALAAFESARALAERGGAEELRSSIENGIGAVHYARGEYDAARRAYAAAQALTHDAAMRGKIILNLGVIENIEGNLERAHEYYERAHQLFRQTGDRGSAMLALHNLGMLEADLGRWSDADDSFGAAFDLATELDNQEMIAKTLVNRSEVLSERGALADAIDHCERALGIYSVVGDEVGRGEALRWMAHATRRTGDLVTAERSATAALHIAMRAGARLLEAEAARELADIRGALGDAAGRLKFLHRAGALFTQLGARREAHEIATAIAHPDIDAAAT